MEALTDVFPPGHVGIALSLYAPFGLLLLARGRPRLAVSGTLAVAGLTLLPDVDSWLPWFDHRGQTHTVWFALAVGAVGGAIVSAAGIVRQRDAVTALHLGAFGFVVGSIAVLAHLLGDVITPMGVRPLAPVSYESYTFSLVYASDPDANARLFALGCVATVGWAILGAGLGLWAPGRSTVRGALRRVADVGRRGPTSRADAPRSVDRLPDRRPDPHAPPDRGVATSGGGRESDD